MAPSCQRQGMHSITNTAISYLMFYGTERRATMSKHDYRLAMAYRDLFIETNNRIIFYMSKFIKSGAKVEYNVLYGIKRILEEQWNRLKEIDKNGGNND